jgi:DNA primase
VIVCEGYTDTIALHQGGMRGAVGLMGTALTGEQVGELARMAQTVLLALDADSAGQEAMLRASSLAAKRKLELRVVPLPEGADPAELIQRDGPEGMRAAVERSVPFVRFRVERVLAEGDDSSPEGRDRMVEELRPVFATLAPSAMRMELTRMVSSRLALPESLAEQLLASGARAGAPSGRGGAAGQRKVNGSSAHAAGLSGREETERAFLALCIASPEEGAKALQGLDVDQHFSSELLRLVARHLREGNLSEPMAERTGQGGDPDEERALERLLAELIVEAGAERANPAMLEVQRLQLELARVDRQIQQERGRDGSDVSTLAQRRAELKREFDRAYGQVLEQTGDREG